MKYEVIGLKIGVWANYMVIHHVLSRKVQLKVFVIHVRVILGLLAAELLSHLEIEKCV